MTVEIPDYSRFGSSEHVTASEICLAAGGRVAMEALELAKAMAETMAGGPGDLELLTLKQQNVQIYLAEAQVHATLAVVKYNRERF
jgi:predicted regulator of Ras-like GTPase activity (Roadblock/LC7/MglB family)